MANKEYDLSYLYAINIQNLSDYSENNKYSELISTERKKRIEQFFFPIDKKRSMYAEILLKYVLQNTYKIDDLNIHFYKNEYGKPFLKEYENIHFNLSHSGEWILCGMGDYELGVDVEQMKMMDLKVAEKYFHPKEYAYIVQNGTESQQDAFYKVWTLKESYIKKLGKGLNIPLNSFSFLFDEKDIVLDDMGKRPSDICFYSNRMDQNHYLAVCRDLREKDSGEEITILSGNDLEKWYERYST